MTYEDWKRTRNSLKLLPEELGKLIQFLIEAGADRVQWDHWGGIEFYADFTASDEDTGDTASQQASDRMQDALDDIWRKYPQLESYDHDSAHDYFFFKLRLKRNEQ